MTVPPPATWRGGRWGLGQKREFGAGGSGSLGPGGWSYVPAGLCGQPPLLARRGGKRPTRVRWRRGGATGKAGKTRGDGHHVCKSFTEKQLKMVYFQIYTYNSTFTIVPL